MQSQDNLLHYTAHDANIFLSVTSRLQQTAVLGFMQDFMPAAENS